MSQVKDVNKMKKKEFEKILREETSNSNVAASDVKLSGGGNGNIFHGLVVIAPTVVLFNSPMFAMDLVSNIAVYGVVSLVALFLLASSYGTVIPREHASTIGVLV